MYSTDGGNSFLSATGLPNNIFNYICDENSFNWYTAVGQNGIIYYNQSSSPYTQAWTQQPGGTTVNLYCVTGNQNSQNPITMNRIAVGAGGTILKSRYILGTSWDPWSPVSSGTSQDLYSVYFAGVFSHIQYPYGWISGNNGTVLKTTNWGDNWSLINLGITNKLYCVRFTDTLTGWIVGSNGLIKKSTNAGINWITIPSGTTADLKSFSTYSVDENYVTKTFYAICGNGGVALISKDNGLTWSQTPTNIQNNLNSNYQQFIVGNSGTILRRDVDSSFIFKKLEGNNISAYFNSSGNFDENKTSGNLSGFEWPKGSNHTAVFAAGLSIAAFYQGQLREAMASYDGEFTPGFCNNGIAHSSDTFKFYSVKRGDTYSTNPDWAHWGLMVPYGAPFVDKNNNGIYDP